MLDNDITEAMLGTVYSTDGDVIGQLIIHTYIRVENSTLILIDQV